MDYWVPGTRVTGVHEMVGNALITDGEIERTLDLRLEELPSVRKRKEAEAAAAAAAAADEDASDEGKEAADER